MIQRPQTVYFLAIIALTMMMAFADITYFNLLDDSSETILAEVQYNKTIVDAEESKNYNLLYFLDCIAVLAAVSIFLFKNRKLQYTLTAINFLFIVGTIYFMYAYSYGRDPVAGENGSLTAAALLPLGIMFLNFLALKRIRHDEKLIRSMNRIR